MADVWVLTSIKNFDADLELDAVVLGNRKILSKNEGTKEMLESDFKAADNIWAEQNEGPMPSNELFSFLNVIHKNPQGIGQIMPVEDARELVKKSGGL